MALVLAKDFKEFLRSLNSHHVEYLLIGGYAVGIYGYVRATNDLDVWINVNPENAARVERALREFGFGAALLDTALFLVPNNVLRMGVPPIRIEILTSISGVDFAACYAEKQMVQIEELLVSVISLSRLRQNKAASGRSKDLADLDNLPQLGSQAVSQVLDSSKLLGRVVGVDGCKFGWIAAAYNPAQARFDFTRHTEFASLVATYGDADAIAVDMPIGLVNSFQAVRRCDVLARKFVGSRRSSVFPAPDRRLLEATSYGVANRLSRELSGKGLTRQSFAIFQKVAEVDRIVSPELQSRVVEVHPEVSFCAAAGRPLVHPKRVADGFNERAAILGAVFPGINIPTRIASRSLPGVGPDDVLDAMIAAWSALRYARGVSQRIPEPPDLDAQGLRMEMIY